MFMDHLTLGPLVKMFLEPRTESEAWIESRGWRVRDGDPVSRS